MSFVGQLLALVALFSVLAEHLDASYRCGIRKHSFVQLVHHGWTVEEGQFPWHVAIFHKRQNSSVNYACGGSLLDEKHVLTAAHCVINRETEYALPASSFELHFGQRNLSLITANVLIRDVAKVHVHPEHSSQRNDIAILVLRLPVQFTDFVIPICLDQKADIDLRNLEGERGWITGWGTTQAGTLSDVLRTASLPVVSYLQCFQDAELAFGNLLNRNVYCAGDRNGTSPGTGDSGGGMYFLDGDQWVLRGIISFAKADELRKEVDTSKFVVFVNVQRFLTWIREVIAETEPQSARGAKRISESECDRFKGFARKRKNGICDNSRYPHSVSLVDGTGFMICNGVLVNENHVITTGHCISDESDKITKVQIDTYGPVDILTMVAHPAYVKDGDISIYDLSVIKLKESVELSSNIIPACLANSWTENLYDTLLHTGYGQNFGGGLKKFIESEENHVITNERCAILLLKASKQETSGVLCVNNTDILRTSIFGSSGSPLQSINTRTCMYTVVGIITALIDLGSEYNYDNPVGINVFTRISYNLDWIEQVIWNVEPPQ